jgi:hypothetical protein
MLKGFHNKGLKKILDLKMVEICGACMKLLKSNVMN